MVVRLSLISTVMRTVFPLIIVAVGIGGFLLLSNTRGKPPRATAATLIPSVETVAAQLHEGGLTIHVDGVVVPFREIKVAAEVDGRVVVKAVECRAGRYVKAGTSLIQIDPRDYELEIRRLTKEAHQADGLIKELDVELATTGQLVELAEEDWKLQKKELLRTESLAASRVITDSDIDQERRDELASRNALLKLGSEQRLLDTRRNRLMTARDLASVALEKAELAFSRSSIVAPTDGVLIEDSVEQGDYVRRGETLFAIEDTSATEVRCKLRMDQLRWIWRRKPAADAAISENAAQDYEIPRTAVRVIYSLDGAEYSWEGSLYRYDGLGVDERTRTVPCRVIVTNPRDVTILSSSEVDLFASGPPALVRGMYVTVEVMVDPQLRIVSIPERAVHPGDMVRCVTEDKIELRRVRVVSVQRDCVMIVEQPGHFAVGDRVVVSPIADARNGMQVRERGTE